MLRCCLFCLMAMLCVVVSPAQITSTFDTDADGWTVFFGASGASIPGTFSATAGNPGGHAFLNYTSATTSVQSWIAPAKFRGNHVARSFGMNLRFDLQQSIASTASGPQGSVRIEATTGVLVYVFSVAERPTTSWRSYILKLDETAGWRWNSTTGALATRSQVSAVMADIDAIEIAATYATNASYTARIDNVIMEEKILPTAPTITDFTPAIGPPGTVVTLTGTSFNALAANNSVFFSGAKANVLTASLTQLTVEVPQGATYGPITITNTTTGVSAESLKKFNPTFSGGGRLIPSSFKRRVDIPITGVTNLNGLTASDVDGDGWMDVIVSESGNTVSIFRNLGTGGDISVSTFAPKVSLSGGGNSSGLRLVDIDGDGLNDIIAHYESASLAYFATFRNTSTPGNLSFEPVELWFGLVYSGSFSSIVDVDGDGRPDLIGQHGNGSVSPDLWIAQNISSPGQIEFGPSISYFGGATLDAGNGVSYGDLDNDGKPDLIVEHGFGGQFQIIKNNSTPGVISFGTPFIINEPVSGGVAVTDINDDGRSDLLFKQGSSSDDVNIRLNNYSGGVISASDFATTIILDTDLSNYGGVSTADMNGDGKVDILATDSYNMAVFENQYAGGAFNSSSFVAGYLHEGVANSTYPTTPVACDFNGDGRPDIVMGITNTAPVRLSFFENQNVITPSISVNTVSPLKGLIGSVVTITGDNFSNIPSENTVLFGTLKAVVLSASKTLLTVEVPVGCSYGYVSVTRNELTSRYHLPFAPIFSPGRTIDATSFGPPVNYTLTGADFDIDVGDMNNDGKVDVLVEAANLGHAFRNVHTSGPITTTSLVIDGSTSSNAQNPKLIDINSDGKLDIASVNGIYRNITSTSTIAFDPLVATGGTTNIGTADFNRDGRTDWAGGTTGPVQIYENRSRTGSFLTGAFGTTSPVIPLSTSGSPVAIATADFDNDGFPDIAAPVTSSIDYISFYRNAGQPKLSATSLTSAQNINTLDLPGRVYEGDLDVDGKMDILIYYQAAGANGNMFSVFHNQSSGPGNVNFVQQDYTIGAITGTAGTVCGPSAIADLDGDGKPEIIITSASTTAARQGFYVFKNNSTPGTIDATSFTSSGLIPLSTARAVAATDINSDGKADLIFTRVNQVSILENILAGVPVTINTQPTSNSVCTGGTIILGVAASGDPGLQYQWQELVGATFANLSDNATYSGTSTPVLQISNLSATTTYRVRVTGGFAITFSNNATVTVNSTPAAPGVTGNTGCAGTSVTLNASGGTNGNYRWYTSVTGGTPIAGAVNSSFATPVLTATTSYFSAISNGACESTRSEAVASITTVAAPASTTGAARCDSGAVTLTATGGANGNYRWYDVSTGGTSISGAVNASYTTPSLSATTTYHVALSNGTCESSRIPVTATVNLPPAKPSITSSLPGAGGVTIGCETVTLSAPAGFSYLWSNGATTQSITVSGNGGAGDYTVQVTDANNCTSVPSDPFAVIVSIVICNTAPVVVPENLTTAIAGDVSLTLSDIVSDAENNFDNIEIVSPPVSGATVTIVNGVLMIDYSKTQFSGTDQLVIRACDIENLCSDNVTITIEVVGEIEVFNAVSPNGDGLNEILRLQYIEVLERTRNNKVTILNRWGDKVFEVSNYDNDTRAFKGLNNNGGELPSGTYFYKIEFTGTNAPPMKTGYFALKR